MTEQHLDQEELIYQFRVVFRPLDLNGMGQWTTCTKEEYLRYSKRVGMLGNPLGGELKYKYTYGLRVLKVVCERFGV